MATVAELIVRARADTQDVERGFARMTRGIEAFSSLASTIGRTLTTSVTLPLAAAGAAVFSATAKMDSLTRGLQAVAGTASATQGQLARLTEIAKLPGIGFAEAIRGSVSLQSIGFSAALAERSLKGFANAIALTGGGRENLNRVNVQLAQLASKGKVLAQDLRPIIENAPAVGRALREAFGTVNAEDIQELNLTTEQFLDRLLTQLEKLPKVSGGLGNAFENLKDSIFRTFAAIGNDQASGLTDFLNSLSATVENVGKAFSALPSSVQRNILLFGGLAAAVGPVLIAVSALTRAYQTLIAINLASSTLQGLRAFIALVPAVNSAASALTLMGFAAKGLSAAMFGPAGIIVGIGLVAAGFVRWRSQASQAAAETEAAANRMVQALVGVEPAVARTMLTRKNVLTANLLQSVSAETAKLELLQGQLSAQMQRINQQPGFAQGKGAPVLPASVLNLQQEVDRQRAIVSSLNLIRDQRIAEIKVLSEVANQPDAPSMSLGGGAGADPDDARKAEERRIAALAEVLRLRIADNRLIAEAEALLNLYTVAARQAADVQEKARFGGMASQLSDALSSLLDLERPVSVVMQNSNRTAQQWKIVGKHVREARSDAEVFARRMTATADALAGLGSVFRNLGLGIGDVIDHLSRAVDSLGALRKAAPAGLSGPIDVAGFLGGVGSLVGSIASIGKALFGTSQRELEAREHQQRLAEAIANLAAKVSGLAGTAAETRLAGVAVDRILTQSGGLGGTRHLNTLIADLGLSMADLSRIANDLGISLYNNGKLSTASLKALAEAIGLNTELLTRFGKDVGSFRSVQQAMADIFELEDTPALAIQNAFAELQQFAPLVFQQLTSGIDAATPEGRRILEQSLRELFTRLTTVGTSLEELGTFTDINVLLESLLRLDNALDKTAEQFEQLNNLNVPQGFKVALARFNATTPVPLPPTPGQASGQASLSAPTSTFTGPVTIAVQGGSSPDEAVRFLAEGLRDAAVSNPQLRAFAAMFAPVLGRN